MTASEHQRNAQNCRNGWDDCDRSKLTRLEENQTFRAEHQRNLSNCKDGAETYDYSKLTALEARTVAVGEQKRNYTACLNGYGYCDPFSLDAIRDRSYHGRAQVVGTQKCARWGVFMPQEVQVGTILMNESPVMTQFFGLESEPYSWNWSLIKVLDGFALDRKIHAAGWSFFFMATELRVVFLGALGAKKIQNALNRVLGKVKGQNFNCLEVTGIVAKRFLGVPYTTVSAHSRHIQQSCQLPSKTSQRKNSGREHER